MCISVLNILQRNACMIVEQYYIKYYCAASRLSTMQWTYVLAPECWLFAMVCTSIPRPGFFKAIQATLRLMENSLMHGGPPCSSFVFINQGTSGRSRENADGRERYESVRKANALLGQCLDRCEKCKHVTTSNFCYVILGYNILLASCCTNMLRITSRFTLLMMLAIARCCYVMVEQPRTSVMPWFSPMKALKELMEARGLWCSQNLRPRMWLTLFCF